MLHHTTVCIFSARDFDVFSFSRPTSFGASIFPWGCFLLRKIERHSACRHVAHQPPYPSTCIRSPSNLLTLSVSRRMMAFRASPSKPRDSLHGTSPCQRANLSECMCLLLYMRGGGCPIRLLCGGHMPLRKKFPQNFDIKDRKITERLGKCESHKKGIAGRQTWLVCAFLFFLSPSVSIPKDLTTHAKALVKQSQTTHAKRIRACCRARTCGMARLRQGLPWP
jgi:hypothetical protein